MSTQMYLETGPFEEMAAGRKCLWPLISQLVTFLFFLYIRLMASQMTRCNHLHSGAC